MCIKLSEIKRIVWFLCVHVTRAKLKEGKLHLSTEGYLFFYQYYHDKKNPSLLFYALYYCWKFDKLLLGVKLEFNNRKKVRLFVNPWKLDSTLLIKTVDQKKKLKVDRKRYLETREIGNKIYQKLWNAEKAVLRGNFRALN